MKVPTTSLLEWLELPAAPFGDGHGHWCPSGYGLGALVQLAVSVLIVILCFFAGGIFMAQILYRGGQAADHPVLATCPEGRYLKFILACVP